MDIEKLRKIIMHNDEVSILQTSMMLTFVSLAKELQDKRNADYMLIEQTSREPKISEVVLSTDEVKIYTVSGKNEWDIKYPYRSIFLNSKGVWERSGTVSPSLDLAYLVYLENKHLSPNSKFTDFAIKMLEIKLEE